MKTGQTFTLVALLASLSACGISAESSSMRTIGAAVDQKVGSHSSPRQYSLSAEGWIGSNESFYSETTYFQTVGTRYKTNEPLHLENPGPTEVVFKMEVNESLASTPSEWTSIEAQVRCGGAAESSPAGYLSVDADRGNLQKLGTTLRTFRLSNLANAFQACGVRVPVIALTIRSDWNHQILETVEISITEDL